MKNCNKCKQTVENCECHIPDEEKHSGLRHLVKISTHNFIKNRSIFMDVGA